MNEHAPKTLDDGAEEGDDAPEGPDDELLPAGTAFGRYTVVRCIGTGGMGAVYEAVHEDLQKRVAIKTLHRGVARSADARARFVREGVAASRIRHPHVVDVSDVGVEGRVPYLVMEYLEGEDLGARMARQGPLPVEELVDVMLPVCAAVGAAHDAGVIHRDLKPENIFLGWSPVGGLHPKVLDFGISRVEGTRAVKGVTSAAALLGTPHYMCPERARGGPRVDARSDQYALGVILYEGLTGRLPFDDESLYALLNAIIAGPLAPPSSLRPGLPDGLEAVVLRAMDRDPDARFASAYELGRALLPFASPASRATWTPVFEMRRVLTPPPSRRAGPADPTVVEDEAPPAQRPTVDEEPAPSEAPAAPRPMPRGTLAIAALSVVALVAGLAMLTREPASARTEPGSPRASAASPATYRVTLSVTPPSAAIELDGSAAGAGSLDRVLPRDGASHTLRVSADGYAPHILTFRDAPPPGSVALTPLPAPAPAAAAVVPAAPPRGASRPRASGRRGPRTSANGAPILR